MFFPFTLPTLIVCQRSAAKSMLLLKGKCLDGTGKPKRSNSYRLLCLLFVLQLFCSRMRTNFYSLLLHWLTKNHSAGTFLLFSCNFRYIIRVWFALHVRGFLQDGCNFLWTDSPTVMSHISDSVALRLLSVNVFI